MAWLKEKKKIIPYVARMFHMKKTAMYMYWPHSFLSIIYISINDTQNSIKSIFPAELNMDRGLWYQV